MSTPVYQPRISVKLRKTVTRQKIGDGAPVSARFKGSMQEINLGDYLADGGGVTTSKSVNAPAGTFSITIADKPAGGALGIDSVYGLVEPADFVEIRASHDAKLGDPTLIMRGLVSRVVRSEAIDGGGRPVRTVTIMGLDYGAFWQRQRLFYGQGFITGKDVLTNFKLFERFQAGFQTTMTGADFVREMITKVVNPYIKNFFPENTTDPTGLLVDAQAKHGVVDIDGVQQDGEPGTIYGLLRKYLDIGPWNELWIDEREAGPTVIYRPNPYLAIDGKTKLQDDAPDPEIIDLPAVDVMAMTVERSDQNVSSYYWVDAPRFHLVGNDFSHLLWGAHGEKDMVDLSAYPNSSSRLYGERLMMVNTEMGADGITSMKSGKPSQETRDRDKSQIDWIYQRRKALVLQNRDNVCLEQGVLRVRGRPDIRPGQYVRLVRGGMKALYFVDSVVHEYQPFNMFSSTLSVSRGTGFAERAKRDGGSSSPYLAELQALR